MAPVNQGPASGSTRVAQIARSSTSDSLSLASPAASRSSRNLGAIGGRGGLGYSPYARRVSRAAAAQEEEPVDDDATIGGDSDTEASPAQQRNGLFGRVKSLPGRALGWLSRSSSSRTLATSTSLADVRAEVEQEQAREHTNGSGDIKRSSTARNLAGAAAPTALPSRLRQQGPKDSLPSSSSMSALSSIASPFAPSGLRSSHSTLNLSANQASSTGIPSFLTTSNLSRHSRAASPALSTASYANSRRSPSPMRNGLVGSMSTFNLAQPRSPSSAFGNVVDTTLGNAALTNGSNPFGLTSRSPFAAGARAGSHRAVSMAGSVRSSSARPEGHALFPYTSTVPRGSSPGIATSHSMREGLSALAAPPSPLPNSAPSTAQKRSYARVGSPLNPRSPFAYTEAEELHTGGFERARKKQMVWDAARGLVSRERLEMEQERDAPPMPKNEAERILEVLEGMGRTPIGEAKRGAVRPKKISVPTPASPGLSSTTRLGRASNGSSAAPYLSRNASADADGASSTKGLQSVLRAREERRRALVEQERDERERERREKAERERRREERRRELERLEREAEEEEELESVMSQDYDDDADERPKRRTRSSTAASKTKHLEPPTPRRSTRASTRNTKSPSPQPTPKSKAKSKSRRAQQEDEAKESETDMEPPAARRKTSKSKSPAPPAETPDTERSRSPPAAPKIVFPPAASSASSTTSGRSSMRPGKSHSSRQHTASSKVFSAREEDLPPIDDEALSKIQMPAMKFPANFSFGATTAATSNKSEANGKESTTSSEKKEPSSSLSDRLSAPPASNKPAFSFASSTATIPAASASAIPPLPKISFGESKSEGQPAPAVPSFKPAQVATDLFAPKSTTSSFSFATPSTSTPALPKPVLPASADGEKPNFFAAIVGEKKAEVPKIAPLPSFSFGSSASTPVVKPTEVITPGAEKDKKVEAPVANPFAAFGKPVSEIIKESAESKKGDVEEPPAQEKEVPKPTFSFGAVAKPVEKTEVAPAAPSPFSLKPTSATSTPFSFGASKPTDSSEKKESSATGFSFVTSAAAAPPAAKPTFTFGTTPATPTSEAKEPVAATAAPASPFGALAPPAPASIAGTDDADGDSGMEDEAEPAAGKAAAPPAPFTFGSAAPASASSNSLFGGAGSTAPSSGFTFGSSDKKEASPSPFGAPAATTPASTTNSLFGAASSAPKPFTFGASAPSPAPASPASASASTPFSFGQPAASAAPASPFAFGAGSGSSGAASASPFGAPSQAASPAPASSTFSFGAAPSNPPASPAATFTFGAAAPSASSASMGQTLSAPGAPAAPSPFGAPSSSSFTFGAASQPASPSTTPSNPTFSFGAAAPAPAGGSPFTFGAPTGGAAPAASPFGAPSPGAAAGAGGFSFGAPTGSGATTPTGGGLFNLGSGGDDAAKSARPIRPLRRRK
ncbi:uncharacterized protein JCM15063_005635 [Sporobolomyces koalae]|uniref:uncharacterized protein n=1 Tax=Sporobolomyces koalae TaxID=500713 RepID=UPI003177B54B